MKLKALLSSILLFFFLLDVCSTFGGLAGIKNVPGKCASVSSVLTTLNSCSADEICDTGTTITNNEPLSASLGTPNPQMITSLYGVNSDGSTYMADGAIIIYNDSYSNDVDANDGVKLSNPSENVAIKTENTLLVVERRHTIVGTDTSFMNLSNMKIQQYSFEIKTSLLDESGLFGYLEDTYLHTRTLLDLNGSNLIDFEVTSVPASYAPNRFRILFMPFVLPVTFTSIKAYPKNKDIVVEWKTANEATMKNYKVQKSNDGNKYITANTIAAKNAASNNYNWLDTQPSEGNNFYRIQSTDPDGKINYSKVVKVYMADEKQAISIYPNPVINGVINLQLTNQAAGIYGIRLFNKLGQVMFSKQINHNAGNDPGRFDIGKSSAHGVYQLEITKPDGNKVNLAAIY
jgi:hypothetical protein